MAETAKALPKNYRRKYSKIRSVYAKEKPDTAAIDESQCYIRWLFLLNLDHLLERIFLMLSLDDLENCKSVCREWNGFMKEHVWGSRICMKTLYPKWKERLADNWNNVSL